MTLIRLSYSYGDYSFVLFVDVPKKLQKEQEKFDRNFN